MSSSRLLSWITRAGNYMEGYRYSPGVVTQQPYEEYLQYLYGASSGKPLFEDTDQYIVGEPPINQRKYIVEQPEDIPVKQNVLEKSSSQSKQEQAIPTQKFGFYYPVNVEIDRVRKERLQGKTSEETRELVQNNFIKALEEFAGKVEMTRLPPFVLKNGKLVAPGMNTAMSDMMKEWAENQNEPRLWSDYRGFLNIEAGFNQGANVAVLVSPPSFGQEGFGTYGFCNVFVRQDDQVIEYVFRYEGEESSLPLSNTLQASLQERLRPHDDLQLLPEQTHTNTANENVFLETPLIVTMDNPHAELAEILTDAGFSEACNMETDNIFLKAIKSNDRITSWKQQYIDTIIQIESMRPSYERDMLKNQAELLRDKCYNKASDIKKAIDAQIKSGASLRDEQTIIEKAWKSSPQFDTREKEDRYYGAKQAVVVGGGSCPGAQSKWDEFKSYENLNSIIGRYGRSETMYGKSKSEKKILECFCPSCDKGKTKKKVKAVIAKGKITCPRCNASAPYKC